MISARETHKVGSRFTIAVDLVNVLLHLFLGSGLLEDDDVLCQMSQ